jgi:hypothetical protein
MKTGMVLDLLGKIKDILSLTVKQVIIAAVASWTLLLLPDSLLTTMGLAGFRGQFRLWIGLAAWLSLSWLIALALYEVGDSAWRRLTVWRTIALGRRLLEDLTPVEKGYLQLYIAQSTTTQPFRLSDGVVQMLEAKRIIYRASDVGKFLDEFDFNIQPWAYRALQANPQLLAGAVPPHGHRRGGYSRV